MLCSVMELISMTLRRFAAPRASSRAQTKSPRNSSAPPPRKPASSVSETFMPRDEASSAAGESREK